MYVIDRIIRIEGKRESLKDYEPSDFVLTHEGDVFVTNKEIGFFRHDGMTKNKLKTHLYKMIMEGFSIDVITDKKTYSKYSRTISDITGCAVMYESSKLT